MRLAWLANAMNAAGLTVIEHSGWALRGQPFEDYTPVGLINHHTAGSSVLTNYPDPPYYRNESLENKCNLTIRGDGTVCVLNAGWAADSGYGDRKVLAAVRADAARPDPTDTYSDLTPVTPGGANPGVLGNAWYIDIEVQHLGNGDPIDPRQRDALIRANAAICEVMGWDPLTRLIGHREWSTRKVDPRWGGSTNPMPQIRLDTVALLTPKEDYEMLPLKKDEKREDVRLLQIKLNKAYGLKLPLSAVYDAATVAAVKAHLGAFTGSPVGQKGEEVVATMYQALEDAVAVKNATAVDPTARINAKAAHQRLDTLHEI